MIKLNSLPIVIKLGILFFALAAILAGGIGVSSYRISSTVIREAQRETMERFSRNISSHLNTFLDDRRTALDQVLNSSSVDSFLSGGDKKALKAYLAKNSRGMLAISYFGPAGKLQAATSESLEAHIHREKRENAPLPPAGGFSTRLIYSETLNNFAIELDYSNLTAARPRGTLKAYIALDSIRKEFAGLTIGQSGFYFITNQEGEIIHSLGLKTASFKLLQDSADAGMKALLSGVGGTAQGILDDKLCYAIVKTVPRYGWKVTAAIPDEAYAAPLKRVKYGILFFSLLIGGLSLLAGLVASYVLITQPVSRLTRAALEISENRNFESRVPAQGEDELGSVARAFNTVLDELSKLYRERLSQSAEKLSSAEAQLRQAQKMEIVGRLAGGVAHDFNNLLTIILSNCTFLMNDIPEGDPRREDVKGIRGAGERAATLTRQLLAFSRKQILQPKLIDLNASVIDTQKIIKRLIGEDIEIKTMLQQSLPPVKADPGQIEQIILNLAVNARDAMPGGGTLHFKTSSLEVLPGTSLEHAAVALPEGKYTVLRVADTGTGMTKNTLSHLFEPFFTTKAEGKGTGLGLSMVYGIVKQSGGLIDVKSAPGSGTVFEIYLPAVAEALQPETQKAAGQACALKAAGAILLVEDDEALLRMTSRILKGAGYSVIEAATAHAALGWLDKDFDLLLTDVTLPDISGVELASHILKAKPGTPVIFTSGYSENEDLREILSKPENNFIQKPFSNEGLLHKILEVLGGRG